MELSEAIQHCEEKAKELKIAYSKSECLECAKEHEQLASWLKELQAFRDSKADVIKHLKRVMNHGLTNIAGKHSISVETIIPDIESMGEVKKDESERR